MSAGHDIPARADLVGPNAVIQLIEPLTRHASESVARRVFERAGLEPYLQSPPEAMVPEAEIRRLFDAVLGELGADAAEPVLFEAGEATAAYVMANRIPAPVRVLLRVLPPAPSARLLLRAIERHAWTFAGSGGCSTGGGLPAHIAIETNPIATPGCPWHRGVFAGLFQSLVTPRIEVRHPACCAHGAPACRFEIHRAADGAG